MTKAIIFDFDGVLVDTEGLKIASYYKALRDIFGIEVDWEGYLEFHLRLVGGSKELICGEIINRFADENLPERLESERRKLAKDLETSSGRSDPLLWDLIRRYGSIYRVPLWEILSYRRLEVYELIKDDARLIKPARDFLERVLESGKFKVGLVSRNSEEDIRSNLAKFGIPEECFDAVVCEAGEWKYRKKWEFYVAACERLRVPGADCLAIEDTAAGVEAARRAGIGCVMAVPNRFTRGHDFIGAGADVVVPGLDVVDGVFEKLSRFISEIYRGGDA